MAALVLDGIQVKRPRCREAAQQGYANATELADYLVAKGVPFREAHHIVGEAVVEAIRQGKPLEDLPLDELQKFSPVIDEDVYPILSLQSCLDKRAAKAASHRSRWRRQLLCAGAVRVICLYCSPENGELTTPTKCDTS